MTQQIRTPRGRHLVSLGGLWPEMADHGGVLGSIRRRVASADLPDPLFAALGALDIAMRVPGAAGRYYGQLVEHGHTRLVEVGTERAVRKRVSRIEETVTPTASRWAVRLSQRQRRQRRQPRRPVIHRSA